MSDRFEDDLMEDLLAEPEGRGASADEYDEAEAYDEADEADEDDEWDEADEVDEVDEVDELEAMEGDEATDELEEAVADVLGADDADEFWGGFKKILSKVGKTVGSVARTVAPIAKMIPIPQAQLIGRVAGTIGNVLADEGDEFDALDAVADYAEEEEDGIDALAPAVAGLAIRSALKNKTAAIPRVHRRRLVKAVSTATKQLARKHGAHAALAAPAIVRAARKIVARRGGTSKQLPAVVNRVARTALRSPRAMRRLVNTGARMRAVTPSALRTEGSRGLRRRRYRGVGLSSAGSVSGVKGRAGGLGRSVRYSTGGGAEPGSNYCPHCRRRTYHLRGPVALTIVSR
jgi:hypothetical protein